MIQSFNGNTSTVYLSSSLMLRLCVAIFTSRLYLYYTFFRNILKGGLNLFYFGNKIESCNYSLQFLQKWENSSPKIMYIGGSSNNYTKKVSTIWD